MLEQFGYGFAGAAVGGGDGVLLRVTHQSTTVGGTTYPILHGAGLASSTNMTIDADYMGAENGTNTWDWSHETTGGYGSRNFMRFYRWSDVDGDPATGFLFNPVDVLDPSFANLGDGPFYLRFRMRTNAYLGTGGHTSGMKFFIWGGPGATGERRMILFIRNGSAHSGSGEPLEGAGGTLAGNTVIDMTAGVSGNYAPLLIPNGEWVHLQFAWKHGLAAASPFFRAYLNNNVEGSPDAEHTAFSADAMGGNWIKPEVWDGGHWGEIVTTGSTSATDAQLDFMDMELGTSFDATWAPA